MSYDGLVKELKKGQVGPLYLLFGDETYLVNEAVARVKKIVLAEGAADFNFDTFYVGDQDASSIRDAIETLPMMAARRLIVVKNFHKLKEADVLKLMPILENPIDTAVVVLVADKIDKRKKVYKTIAKQGVLVECKRIYDNQVPGWIDTIAKKYKLRLDREAQSLLQQCVGNNLNDIDNEMRKLQQYLGDETQVTGEIVSRIVSRSRLESVFELANAIGRCDRAQALVRLAQLLDQGQNEVGVLAMVARHFRILSDIREGARQGLRGSKLSQTVGVHPYFLDQYLDQSRDWSNERIRKTSSALLETDRALKSSPLSSHIWLENFVLKTCG